VSFAAITLYVASHRVLIVVSIYFVIDSVRILLDTPSCVCVCVCVCVWCVCVCVCVCVCANLIMKLRFQTSFYMPLSSYCFTPNMLWKGFVLNVNDISFIREKRISLYISASNSTK
jgi:hypothetical protein